MEDILTNQINTIPTNDEGAIPGRADRYGKTERKHITLTTEAIAAIEAWANRHEVCFSVAVESLALLGLGRTEAEVLPRLVANVLERIVNWQFNRFAKLLAQAVLASERVNYKADVLLLQMLWREARQDPAGFEQKMSVSKDPAAALDARVRHLRDAFKQTAEKFAVTQLKQPLSPITPMLSKDVTHE